MSQPRKPPSRQQIEDWKESPVTEALLAEFEDELVDIRDRSATDCLVYGEPQKTQENIVGLEAREHVFANLVAILSGDWSYFEEGEIDE